MGVDFERYGEVVERTKLSIDRPFRAGGRVPRRLGDADRRRLPFRAEGGCCDAQVTSARGRRGGQRHRGTRGRGLRRCRAGPATGPGTAGAGTVAPKRRRARIGRVAPRALGTRPTTTEAMEWRSACTTNPAAPATACLSTRSSPASCRGRSAGSRPWADAAWRISRLISALADRTCPREATERRPESWGAFPPRPFQDQHRCRRRDVDAGPRRFDPSRPMRGPITHSVRSGGERDAARRRRRRSRARLGSRATHPCRPRWPMSACGGTISPR